MTTITEPAGTVVKVTQAAPTKARVSGATVVRGPIGPQGPAGKDGKDGLNGRDGVDGLNGTNGVDGINGTNGKDGVDGKDGIDGGTPTQMEVAALVAQYIAANPPRDGIDGIDGTNGTNGVDGKDGKDGINGTNGIDGKDGADATQDQIDDRIIAYFTANPQPNLDDYVTVASKGQPNGVGSLDASGNLAQRIKSAAGTNAPGMRDTVDLGNGKASLYTASIASENKSVIIVKSGIWRGELSYGFRAFGTTDTGVIDLTFFRNVVDGATFFGYVNKGTVPVTVTYGMSNDGYSSWAIAGMSGRTQIVVTDAACVGNGTGDPEVLYWRMESANDTGSLSQHVTVPKLALA